MIRKVLLVIGAVFAVLALTINPASAAVLGPTWNHVPGHQPYVMVEDHTSSSWPVYGTTRAWNFGLHYGRCSNSQCIRVYQYNGSRNGTIGYTQYSYYPDTNRFAVVSVHMNQAYAYLPYANRFQAIGQELGHSLGLDHDPYTDIMYPYDHGYDNISTYERNELNQIYSH